nr:MAG TPA: hypothetical protein [Caudoviricetes sp.]
MVERFMLQRVTRIVGLCARKTKRLHCFTFGLHLRRVEA